MEYKLQTSVIEPPKKESNIENLPDPDSDEFLFRDIDESRLNSNLIKLQESGEDDNYSGDSKCFEPSDGDKGKIKSELVEFLYYEENRFAKLKDVRYYLQGKGFKISENQVRQLLSDICKSSVTDRKTGFILKDNYLNKEDYERKNPRKKVKDE